MEIFQQAVILFVEKKKKKLIWLFFKIELYRLL